ncbi:E3 ubiquitin-protein ligase znrf1 isoform X2 [Chiloscyllium plagiosum]|uniref:E3 ubiquitin-protein ligase znrf1 isoform X2 n=1 Tax=Chiloscyllium plagiosum TaxID=36176 RepID=UPI001CB84CB2|nr:E3 ubiquitin-protein ligase znrf1 isoform X2 [Chiloscyllium plagiosum]
MGGKQSTAARSRTAFPGVSSDDSAVHAAHYGHYRAPAAGGGGGGGGGGGPAMGLRTRSVSSVAAMEPAHAFGLYGGGGSRAGGGGGGRAADGVEHSNGGGGGGPDSAGNGYQETGGGGGGGPGPRELQLYLGSRAASLSDSLPLHLAAPRWFNTHSGNYKYSSLLQWKSIFVMENKQLTVKGSHYHCIVVRTILCPPQPPDEGAALRKLVLPNKPVGL